MSGLTQEPPDPPVRERSRGERGDRRGERVPRGRVEHAEERVGDARRGGRAEQRQDDERRRRGRERGAAERVPRREPVELRPHECDRAPVRVALGRARELLVDRVL